MRARLRLTGETSIEAIAGFPTLSDHQGTKIEIETKTRVKMPATKEIRLVLFCKIMPPN
jgi:hypothetical protein